MAPAFSERRQEISVCQMGNSSIRQATRHSPGGVDCSRDTAQPDSNAKHRARDIGEFRRDADKHRAGPRPCLRSPKSQGSFGVWKIRCYGRVRQETDTLPQCAQYVVDSALHLAGGSSPKIARRAFIAVEPYCMTNAATSKISFVEAISAMRGSVALSGSNSMRYCVSPDKPLAPLHRKSRCPCLAGCHPAR